MSLHRKGRTLGVYGGVKEWFATEDGKHYKGMSQDDRAVLQHVRRQNAAINLASRKGRKARVAYRGSIPWPLKMDWMNKNHYTPDQVARNEDRSREKMDKHFSGSEYRKLFANDYRRPT